MIKPEDYLHTTVNSQISKIVTEQIDYNKYLSLGWYQVNLTKLPSKQLEKEILIWLQKNCKENYFFHGKEFLFENEKDAIMFTLAWV